MKFFTPILALLIVVLAVKAHQLSAVAADVPKLFGPDTVVVTMQNRAYFAARIARKMRS